MNEDFNLSFVLYLLNVEIIDNARQCISKLPTIGCNKDYIDNLYLLINILDGAESIGEELNKLNEKELD